MKRQLILVCSLLVTANLFFYSSLAQNYVDLVTLEYNYSPKAMFEDQSGETSVTEINTDITIPVPINDQWVALSGLVYEESTLNLNPNTAENTRFGFLLFKAGALFKANEKWSIQAVALPRWAATIDNISSDAFQMGGLVQANYKKNEFTTWKFAFYGNDEFLGPFFIPFVGLYHRKDNLLIDWFIPARAEIGYFIKDNFWAGLAFKGRIASNLMTGGQFTENQYLHRLTNEVGAYMSYRWNNLMFTLNGGVNIGRFYRVYNRGDEMKLALSIIKVGDNRTQLNPDLEDGLFIKGGIKFRLDVPTQEDTKR